MYPLLLAIMLQYCISLSRIPAIVSHGDWILAFCEGRIQTSADHGAIDIILRRAKVTNGKPEWDKNVIVVVPSGQGYR